MSATTADQIESASEFNGAVDVLDPLDPVVHQRRWLILGVLCMSLLIIVMDNTILNVAIPSLMRDFEATNSQVQWIIDSYVVVFAGLLLTAGSLSDRFGRKGFLQIGIVLFSLGSIAAANSQSATQLIYTRAFMGIGGAMIMPATLAILTNVFRDPKERGRAIAVWAGFSGLGVAIGPMTGGFLIEHFSWSAVFWVNVPIAIVALVLGAFLVPTSRDPRHTKLDPIGALLSIVGLATLLYGIIEGPAKGWTSTEVAAAFVVAAISLTAFIVWERNSTHPMLDTSVFKIARFTAASTTITLVFFALFGSLYLMTQYWQLVHGYSPLQAGVRLLPYAVTMMVVAPLSARVVERVGTKRVVIAGLLLIALGLSLLSTIAADSPYPQVIAYFMIMASGMGMTMAPATESVMGALPRSKAGVGSAVNDTTRQVGGALGVAIIGSAVSSAYASNIASLSSRFGLDAATAAKAESSLGNAQQVGGSLGERASQYISEANNVFVDAMSVGMRVSVAVILLAAVVAWRYLPAHAANQAPAERDQASEWGASGSVADANLAPQPAPVTAAPPAAVTAGAGD